MTATIDIAASGEREFVFTRLFEAPPHLVFEAHTVPALMRRWFTGPDGWKLTTCEIDLRPGGAGVGEIVDHAHEADARNADSHHIRESSWKSVCEAAGAQ